MAENMKKKLEYIEFLKPPEAKIHSFLCLEWRSTHKNCKGCSSEKPCKEYMERAIQHVKHVFKEKLKKDGIAL